MKKIIMCLFGVVLGVSSVALAAQPDTDIASANYVDNKVATCVRTDSTANQQLEGTYVIVQNKGILNVPTPDLPQAE